MTDAASRITYFPERQLLSNVCTHFPQSKPLHLPPLTSAYRHQLPIMLQIKRSPRDFYPQYSIKTPPPGANGGACAAGFTLPLTSKSSNTQFLSSIFFLSASMSAIYSRKGNPSRGERSTNTSAPSVKSSHPWGMTTPTITVWGNSTLIWDARWRPIRRKILLQQECGPSQLTLSKTWTPPPKEPHQGALP